MQILRITRGKVQAGTWDQFERALRDVVKEIGSVPGLVSRSLVRDINDPDEGYSLSVWENLKAVEDYEKSALAGIVMPMLNKFFTGDYKVDHCEVRYWDYKV